MAPSTLGGAISYQGLDTLRWCSVSRKRPRLAANSVSEVSLGSKPVRLGPSTSRPQFPREQTLLTYVSTSPSGHERTSVLSICHDRPCEPACSHRSMIIHWIPPEIVLAFSCCGCSS